MLETPDILIKLADGSIASPIGKCYMTCSIGRTSEKCLFYILKSPFYDFLLGVPWLRAVRAITEWVLFQYLINGEVMTPTETASINENECAFLKLSKNPNPEFKKLVADFSGIFASKLEDFSGVINCKHSIDTGNAKPIQCRIRIFHPDMCYTAIICGTALSTIIEINPRFLLEDLFSLVCELSIH